MASVAATVEDLHEAVFGFRPAKAGTAYERLTAVVLAMQGWEQVVHDTTESAPGKRAEHQLDVVGRDPSGHIERLIVECKDWDRTVGKSTLDTLVGVRDQLNADAAAVITTVGYKRGAINVAVDENLGLWRLRPFDPEHPDLYVKEITITLISVASTYSDFDVELMPEHEFPSGTEFRVRAAGDEHLLYLDGSPAETFHAVLESQHATANDAAGPYKRRASFDDGRRLPVERGESVPIRAFTWIETVHHSPHVMVIRAQGEPMLVLEQLDESGGIESGRVVVDRDLFAWDIDADGNVTPRGTLQSDESASA